MNRTPLTALTTPVTRRTSLALATSLVGALALASCSDPGSETTTQSGPASWPSATDKLDGVELTFWAAQSSAKIPQNVVKAFQEATGAKVSIVTIPDPYEQGVQTKVATGDLPDLAMWQPTTSQLLSLGAKERLQPLDGAPWEAATDASVLGAGGTLDGKRYAAFVSAPSVMGVWYNKKVFEANGVTVPKSFEELLTTARSLKAKGVTPFYEMGGEWWASSWPWSSWPSPSSGCSVVERGTWHEPPQAWDPARGRGAPGGRPGGGAAVDGPGHRGQVAGRGPQPGPLPAL